MALAIVEGSTGSLNTTTTRALSGTSVFPFGGSTRTILGGRRGETDAVVADRTEPSSISSIVNSSPTRADIGTGSKPPFTIAVTTESPLLRFRTRALEAVGALLGGSDTYATVSVPLTSERAPLGSMARTASEPRPDAAGADTITRRESESSSRAVGLRSEQPETRATRASARATPERLDGPNLIE
jgi:hypothetical protein